MGGGGSKKQQAADVDSGAMASVLRGDSSNTAAPTNIGEKQQTNKETNDRIVNNNNKDNNVNDNAISSTKSTPPSAVDSSNTAKDSTDTLARATKAEQGVLPVPEEALRWVENKGDFMTKLNDEKETQVALKWLQKGLVNAHLSPNIKKEVKRLLAVDDFTSNMGYMEIFNPLQTFCKERLLEIGAPLQQMYQQDKTIQDLANLSPVLHPELANHPTISHLRQDHPIIGLSSPFDHSNFNGESMYIHFIRLVALLINERYQEMVKNTVAPLGGDHKGCAIKGDSRMRNKALAKDDHRSEEKPRPAMNIDISRCCTTFDNPESMKNGIEALVKTFSKEGGHGNSGIGRIKNGFALSDEAAAKSFHYRSYMMNIIVDFGISFGELVKDPKSVEMLNNYVERLSENPKEPIGRWKRHAEAAVAHLRSKALSSQNVMMICEVQVLLRPYLHARKKMHLLYKVVRADSDVHLATQFAVNEVEGREKNATWSMEEKNMVEKTRGEVEDGYELALKNACFVGFPAAVTLALETIEDVDVNQADNNGTTSLITACQDGHFDIVQLLLQHKDILVNQARNDGVTSLMSACQNGHFDIVQLLLQNKDILVNQAKNDGFTSLISACDKGHFDIAQLLLSNPDIDIEKDVQGWTPLMFAKDGGHTQIIKLLEQHKK